MFRTTAHVYDLIYGAIGKNYAAEADLLDQIIHERNERAASLLDVAGETEPGHVDLEFAEGVFIQDAERAHVVLDELRRLG